MSRTDWQGGGRSPGCFALIPIKARAQCKSRLSALPSSARAGLADLMLRSVLHAVRSSRSIAHVSIVSPERWQVPPDVLLLPDEGSDLNTALHHARQRLIRLGAKELVVVPADLPFARAGDIEELVRAGRCAGLALVSNSAGVGTNALYLSRLQPFEFRFGLDSRAAHLRQARQLGFEPTLVRSKRLELDLDVPANLLLLRSRRDARFAPFTPS